MEYLKEIRKSQNKTQQECAAAIGITQQMFSKIENGKRRPSVNTAQAIAKALNFDWQLFFPMSDTT